jgi:hypothetical protein
MTHFGGFPRGRTDCGITSEALSNCHHSDIYESVLLLFKIKRIISLILQLQVVPEVSIGSDDFPVFDSGWDTIEQRR